MMKKIKFTPLTINDGFKVLHGIGAIGDGMQPHLSDRDAFLMILDGSIQFDLDGQSNYLRKDDCITIPKNKPHSFVVVDPCKVALTLDADAKISFL